MAAFVFMQRQEAFFYASPGELGADVWFAGDLAQIKGDITGLWLPHQTALGVQPFSSLCLKWLLPVL